jgi:hypothetical protein
MVLAESGSNSWLMKIMHPERSRKHESTKPRKSIGRKVRRKSCIKFGGMIKPRRRISMSPTILYRCRSATEPHVGISRSNSMPRDRGTSRPQRCDIARNEAGSFFHGRLKRFQPRGQQGVARIEQASVIVVIESEASNACAPAGFTRSDKNLGELRVLGAIEAVERDRVFDPAMPETFVDQGKSWFSRARR